MRNLLALLLFVPSLCLAQLPDYVSPDGLTSWFNFDGNLEDLSESTISLDPTNTTYDAGLGDSIPGALSFDGSAYVYICNSNCLNINHGDATISIWCKPNTVLGANRNLIRRDQSGSSALGIRLESSGKAQVLDHNQAGQHTLNSPFTLPLNSWTHLVYTRSETDQISRLFVNGVLEDSIPFNPGGLSTSGNFYFGCLDVNWERYHGLLDEAGTWSRALVPAEISALYQRLPISLGCTDTAACNYDSNAELNNESCEYGCLYCGEGTVWDSTLQECVTDLTFPTAPCGEGTIWDPVNEECIVAVPTDSDFDGCVTPSDLLNLLATFGTCPPIPEWPNEPTDTTWICGDPVTYWDYDYATALIGDQCWFAENLQTETYSNGDLIESGHFVAPPGGYGTLYRGAVVIDNRNICPAGWQVSSDGDWLDLETFLGGEEDDLLTFAYSTARLLGIGDLLKPLGEYTDSGFDAEFGGYVNGPNTEMVTDLGENGQWWTSTQVGANLIYRNVENSTTGISRIAQPVETYAFSIRCIQEVPVLGCTDSLYIEFNPLANVDDGSCFTLAATEWTCGDSLEYWGYWYQTTQIGNQCWFAENLSTLRYQNGDSIYAPVQSEDWYGSNWDIGTGATCTIGQFSDLPCYDLSGSLNACDPNESLYDLGRLYNWFAIDDDRKCCPSGWSVPVYSQVSELKDWLSTNGFEGEEGRALKSTIGWRQFSASDPPLNGTDDFGFTSYPAGWLGIGGGLYQYEGIGSYAFYWYQSAGGFPGNYSRPGFRLETYHQEIELSAALNTTWGGTVRCIKD